MDLIEKILLERPTFHRSETEIGRPFDPSESHLPEAFAKQLASGTPTCDGIEPEVAHYPANSVGPGTRTLEIRRRTYNSYFRDQGGLPRLHRSKSCRDRRYPPVCPT